MGMKTTLLPGSTDIAMLGTFSVWTRGTLQSRALPLARSITSQTGLRVAIVTTPWDDPESAGKVESSDGVTIFNTQHIHPSKSPLAVAEQACLLRHLRPTLMHVMKPKGFGGLTAQLRTALPDRIPLVVDIDDWEGDGGWNDLGGYGLLSRRLFAYQERHLLRRAEQVTAASTLLEERARRIRCGLVQEGVTYLPNGLDPSWLLSLRQAGQVTSTSESKQSVLLYSRFAEFSVTWLRLFVSSLDRLVQEPTTFEVIGDFDMARLGRLEFQNITLRSHGYLRREQLPAALGKATIALFPYEDNLINRSKQSVKLLELMASGRPIVACDVGDIARIGGAAIEISSSPDAPTVAGCVAGLLRDDSRRQRLGREAGNRAGYYSIETLAQSLLGVYERAGLRC